MSFNRSTTSESFNGNLNPPTERSKPLVKTTPGRFSSRFRADHNSQLLDPIDSLAHSNTDLLPPYKRASVRDRKREPSTAAPTPAPSTTDLAPSTALNTTSLANDMVVANKSRFLSLSTGFSFQKDNTDNDDQTSYTLRVFKSPLVQVPETDDALKTDSDDSSTVPPQKVSYKIEDIPVVDEKNDYSSSPESVDPLIVDTVSTTERPSPISFVINNLPEPGQKPIVIQLKARTGPRAHGPRIASDEIVPIYTRPFNRVIETQNEKSLTYENSVPQNRERPTPENKSNSDIDLTQNVPKAYRTTIHKRPTPSPLDNPENPIVQQNIDDSQEADSIITFLRQPHKSRKSNVESGNKENTTLDDNRRNNDIEALPNSLSRRKVFRDIFNAKTESSISNQPNVSPFKTLENLRRDVIEAKTVPQNNKNQNINQIVSTTQSYKHNVRGHAGSFDPFESEHSYNTEFPLIQNLRSNERKSNRPSTSTEYPTFRRKQNSRKNIFSNPITQNILQNIKHISTSHSEPPVVEKVRKPVEKSYKTEKIEIVSENSDIPVSENSQKFNKKPTSFKKLELIAPIDESLDFLSDVEEIHGFNKNYYEEEIIETTTKYEFRIRPNRRREKVVVTSEKTPIVVETVEDYVELEDTNPRSNGNERPRDNDQLPNRVPNFANAAFDIPSVAIPLYNNNYQANRTKQYQVTTPRRDVIRKSTTTSESPQLVGGFLRNSNNYSTDSPNIAEPITDQVVYTDRTTDHVRQPTRSTTSTTTTTTTTSTTSTTTTTAPPSTPLATSPPPTPTPTPSPTTTPTTTTSAAPPSTPTSPPSSTTPRPTPPGRMLRVNPAIKFKATMTASRRSYSPSKCTENNLQNPKCNEINLQRYRQFYKINKTLFCLWNPSVTTGLSRPLASLKVLSSKESQVKVCC